MSDVAALMARAEAAMGKVHDPNLVGKMTLVQGYSGMLDGCPDNVTYRSELRKAVEQLRLLLDAGPDPDAQESPKPLSRRDGNENIDLGNKRIEKLVEATHAQRRLAELQKASPAAYAKGMQLAESLQAIAKEAQQQLRRFEEQHVG